jgi:hypothetical protein
MFKKTLLLLAATLVGISAQAQTAPPGTISQRPAASVNGTTQSASGTIFTNRSGASYSTEQLATQLQNLRSAVDQSLPMVTAFTETASNAAPSGARSLAGTVTQILSGVLNRNSGQTNSAAGISAGGTNILATLQGLLTTNSPASASFSADALRDLAGLQAELQNLSATLQRLNVSSGTNFGSGLTPTGR